jgi:hypothetical protein
MKWQKVIYYADNRHAYYYFLLASNFRVSLHTLCGKNWLVRKNQDTVAVQNVFKRLFV